MSLPIQVTHAPGANLYVIIRRPDGMVANNQTEAWEAYNQGNWSQYAVALTEQGASGYYRADLPDWIAADVLTTECVYIRAGGAPAVGDAPPIAMGQSQGVNVHQIAGDGTAPQNLEKSLSVMARAAVAAGAATNQACPTTLADTTDDVYVGRLIVFTSGALIRQVANVTAYDGDTKRITYAPLTGAPAQGDTFIIV